MDLTTEFTPWLSLAGGALIGLAATVMLLGNGAIAGVSGIVSRLMAPATPGSRKLTALAFIVGLLLAAPLYGLFSGHWPVQQMVATTPVLIVAGLLVGFGTVLGNGCTSGHGVCGISRFSVRSFVATLVFMGTGFVAVLIIRHLAQG